MCSRQSDRKNIGLVLLPLVLALGIAGGIFIGSGIQKTSMTAGEAKLRSILGLISDDYVDEVSVDSLLEQTYPELLGWLDPHSAYIPAKDLQAVNDDLEGSFSGIGVSFQILNDSVVVVEVIPGGPAEKVGILPGDRIVAANGKNLTGKDISNEDVFATLRGPENTKAELKIKRNTSRQLLSYDVRRGKIPVRSVDCAYMIAPAIGYVRVTKFARDTYDEFYSALDDLKAEGAKKYIVDLRNNSGGFMDQAVLMVNEFLPKDKVIVYTKGRKRENEMYTVSDGTGSFTDAELTVLTNEFSASASEIFAGAIQDNDRGLVVGRRSFGKGLVQNQTMLPDSSALRLTVARYYTPSGRSIQKEYSKGKGEAYDLDISDRYSHGEFYSADSVKLDKSKRFSTAGGRTVYGGGGIMPDIFVPEDTTGFSSYYLSVANAGLLQKFAFDVSDRYRSMLNGVKDLNRLLKVLPRDNTLLENFVEYAAANGVAPRWYYIRRSRDLLLSQIKAFIARDVLGYAAFVEMLNKDDRTVIKAVDLLQSGKSPVVIPVAKSGADGVKSKMPSTRKKN